MLALQDETRHIWKLDGLLGDNPNDEIPPIWDLLDHQPSPDALEP